MAIMLERASQIVATLEAAIAEAGDTLAGVTVTLDSLSIPSGSRAGVVAVLPPVLDLTTYAQTEATWNVLVCAGPPSNMLAAWGRIDDILAAVLTTDIAFESATPDAYRGQDSVTLPAYMLTLTETLTETATQ
jgi:hypothetical protein